MAGPLVGRAEELQFLVETLCGEPARSAVVAGGPGVGKTRLAREVAAALDGELAVEWAAATPASASIPFGALSHLLPDAMVCSPDDRLRLLRGIGAALAERAGGRASLLVVDDAQWLDAGAAAFVHQHVIGGGRALLTLRAGEAVMDPVAALWKDDWADRLELQPLGRLDLDALVESVLERPVDRTTKERFWTLSAGNPLFARELLLGALETDALRERDGVWSWIGAPAPTTRLAAILQDRLTRVSSDGRSALEHLAVGEPLRPDVLTGLVGRSAVAEVERAGLVDLDPTAEHELRLSHPIYAEVLRSQMPSVERRTVMGALADAMENAARSSRAVQLRVARWRLDSDTPAPEWLFTESAEIANAVYDHEQAERLARRAIREGGGLRAALTLGDALNRQGRTQEGLAILDPLVDIAVLDDEHVAVASARYFGLSTAYGFRPEFESVLLDAEERVQDEQRREYLRAERATLLMFVGRLEEAIELTRSVQDGEAAELTALRAVPALGGAWSTMGQPGSTCRFAERMIEPSLRWREMLPQAPSWVISTYLPALVHAGRLDDADAAVELVERSTAAPGASADGGAFVSFVRGTISLHRGRPVTAQLQLREGIAGLREIARFRLPYPLGFLIEACALTRDEAGAEAASAECDELVAHAAVFEGLARRGRGWLALARGQLATATDLFVEAGEWCMRRGHRMTALFAFHDAVRLGETKRAIPALVALGPGMETAWAPAFVDHAQALAHDDATALERSSTRFEELGAALLAAEAAAGAAAAFARASLPARAERASARARVLAGACEGTTTPLLESLAQPVSLTAREREVARLAATGLSSPAIAERLFVSTRTVEGHLQRAYAKLGIADRRDLARVLQVAEAAET